MDVDGDANSVIEQCCSVGGAQTREIPKRTANDALPRGRAWGAWASRRSRQSPVDAICMPTVTLPDHAQRATAYQIQDVTV